MKERSIEIKKRSNNRYYYVIKDSYSTMPSMKSLLTTDFDLARQRVASLKKPPILNLKPERISLLDYLEEVVFQKDIPPIEVNQDWDLGSYKVKSSQLQGIVRNYTIVGIREIMNSILGNMSVLSFMEVLKTEGKLGLFYDKIKRVDICVFSICITGLLRSLAHNWQVTIHESNRTRILKLRDTDHAVTDIDLIEQYLLQNIDTLSLEATKFFLLLLKRVESFSDFFDLYTCTSTSFAKRIFYRGQMFGLDYDSISENDEFKLRDFNSMIGIPVEKSEILKLPFTDKDDLLKNDMRELSVVLVKILESDGLDFQ